MYHRINPENTSRHSLRHHLHTKRHTVVLDKGDVKPIGNRNMLAIIHICFHHNLNDLVQNKREQDDAQRQPEFVVFLVHIALITHE